jgi:hypothetical protein
MPAWKTTPSKTSGKVTQKDVTALQKEPPSISEKGFGFNRGLFHICLDYGKQPHRQSECNGRNAMRLVETTRFREATTYQAPKKIGKLELPRR